MEGINLTFLRISNVGTNKRGGEKKYDAEQFTFVLMKFD